MQCKNETVTAYINALESDRAEAMQKLRKIICDNLPEGFDEVMAYNMPTYVVPLERYPKGYHVSPNTPLPFISIASQKNHIAFYHLGLSLFEDSVVWFQKKYSEVVPTKLDMGKSCLRLKNVQHIPYDLIGELCQRVSVEQYIVGYEQDIKKATQGE